MAPVDETVSELLRGLRHSSPVVRVKAARGLVKFNTPPREAFAVLLKAVDDPEQSVREASIQALATYGQLALPSLAEFLTHPDKYVRRNAVWAIGKLGPAARTVLPELCVALRDADPRTAAGAAQALGNMGEAAGPAVPPLVEAMSGTNVVLCRLAAKSLSQIGQPALMPLIENLRHHDPFVRAEAALALGWMGNLAHEAVSELVQLVETYRPKVLSRSAEYRLANHSGTVTPPALPATSPQSSEESARLNGIQALGRIGTTLEPAIELLKEISSLEAEPYRTAAALAIRQLESSRH
jgi:HEAT repeat protein